MDYVITKEPSKELIDAENKYIVEKLVHNPLGNMRGGNESLDVRRRLLKSYYDKGYNLICEVPVKYNTIINNTYLVESHLIFTLR